MPRRPNHKCATCGKPLYVHPLAFSRVTTGGLCRPCWRVWNKEHNTKYMHTQEVKAKTRRFPKGEQESCLEGWTLLQAEKGQLCECKVCSLPTGIHFNGTERRLCYGAQADNGSVTWQTVDENGMRSSYRSQPIEQRFRELDVICDECIAQKIRDTGLSGSYAGFQPKPAVEVVLVVMKPLSRATYTDQALANGKGVTWLDDCRIPYDRQTDDQPRVRDGKQCDRGHMRGFGEYGPLKREYFNQQGRFPANLLVSDDVLNDGKNYKTGDINPYIRKSGSLYEHGSKKAGMLDTANHRGDSGSYSRYFDLEAWSRVNLPWLSDISNDYNIENTFHALLVWFADHMRHRRLSHLGKGLCDALHVLPDALSFDTTLWGNKLRIALGHDVRVLDDTLCKLLSQSVHSSLRKNLPANVVFDAQNVTSQLSSLAGCLSYRRLYDELLGLVANLSREFLLLLVCVAEQIHACLRVESQDDTHENIYHQTLASCYAVAGYRLLNLTDSSTPALSKWFSTTFPFCITPKASKSERNMTLDECFGKPKKTVTNFHNTVKPIKLMSWLITLGSRPGDLILDPFAGSGTTLLAAKMLGRRAMGLDINKEYCLLAKARKNHIETD